jgi:ATP-dependent Zn protease
MPFGNEDAIDKVNRQRIQELNVRNALLEQTLRRLINALSRSASLTQNEKEAHILEARQVLRREA